MHPSAHDTEGRSSQWNKVCGKIKVAMEPTRRDILRSLALAAAARGLPRAAFAQAPSATLSSAQPLAEVDYSQVQIKSPRHLAQMENTHAVLMGLSDDSLLMPFRKMAGQSAPGEDIGGWYQYNPTYDHHHGDAGFAPGVNFGQWVSALARVSAATGDAAVRERVLRLNRLFAQAISPAYFANNLFPAYGYDKLVCGLMDAHRLANDPDAFSILDQTTAAAVPALPGYAVDREVSWRIGQEISHLWDESFTMPENLYLVSAMGAGRRYREMATAYLLDATYFDPLARSENVLADRHAYSYVNALCSAMQAYFVGGSAKHFLAARNGFDFLEQQSYATGGWGPDELLRKTGYDEVFLSLTKSHNSFEAPCGSYAHMKLTRYLLRATRDGRYGDSMERVMWNTVLGALPLQPDGRSFYSADYNVDGRRIYSVHRWPCCSGTLPQVTADYGINTYLREPGAVWVNLYLPSVLRWTEGGSQLSLEQDGSYPYSSQVRLRITASKPATFAIKLRIPAWADGAQLVVNGKATAIEAVTGFTTLHRNWKNGDRIELDLPVRPRLEAFSAAHPDTVALMTGPLVLFPLGSAHPAVTREQALAARRVSASEWAVDSSTTTLRLVPFTEIGDLPYSTYLKLA